VHPQPVCTLWEKEKSFAPTKNRTTIPRLSNGYGIPTPPALMNNGNSNFLEKKRDKGRCLFSKFNDIFEPLLTQFSPKYYYHRICPHCTEVRCIAVQITAMCATNQSALPALTLTGLRHSFCVYVRMYVCMYVCMCV
jgi:hypothetical protein